MLVLLSIIELPPTALVKLWSKPERLPNANVLISRQWLTARTGLRSANKNRDLPRFRPPLVRRPGQESLSAQPDRGHPVVIVKDKTRSRSSTAAAAGTTRKIKERRPNTNSTEAGVNSNETGTL